MKYGYVYIVGCIAIVSIGTFAMHYFASTQSYNDIHPAKYVGTPDCIGHMPKARELAEDSIGQATMSSYHFHFDGIQCVWGIGTNGI